MHKIIQKKICVSGINASEWVLLNDLYKKRILVICSKCANDKYS